MDCPNPLTISVVMVYHIVNNWSLSSRSREVSLSVFSTWSFPVVKRRIPMFRLVSYRSDHTAPTWHAGIASHHALIDLAGYAAVTSRNQTGGTYLSVRSYLSASQDEQEQILAWATRQFDRGAQVLSLDEVELGPPVPDPEKILCL